MHALFHLLSDPIALAFADFNYHHVSQSKRTTDEVNCVHSQDTGNFPLFDLYILSAPILHIMEVANSHYRKLRKEDLFGGCLRFVSSLADVYSCTVEARDYRG
jgi:hypothetical protein